MLEEYVIKIPLPVDWTKLLLIFFFIFLSGICVLDKSESDARLKFAVAVKVGTDNFRIMVSWQARLHLNKRVKFYSLCLGNFEPGRRYVNIRFLIPAKLRSGDYIFKYSLLRPGEA